jgi:2,4-dienoyl-CoA reductase-like NADH-dependent reductase (Old Yellow Enzyme family)
VSVLVHLLDTLDVKGLTLKNRIVMPPMQTSLASTEGAVTDELIEHYVQRSREIGLLIVVS